MTLTLAFSDTVPGGDATTPKTGDLSSVVTVGSTNAAIRITNTGNDPCSLYWRDTGTSGFSPKQLIPQDSVDVWVSLTAARTFEYYFDASVLKVEVAYFFGGGLTSTVTVSDITDRIVALGYTVSASGDVTSAQVQLWLNDITTEVTVAATRYALIASQTLNVNFKNLVIINGTIAKALMNLRNKGASQGRIAQAIAVSSSTADMDWAEYKAQVERISQGIYYGA